MRYISTRGGVEPLPFKDVVLMGLADDGGLLVPEILPDVREHLAKWKDLSYRELALEIIKRFVDDIPESDLAELINKSYGENFPKDVTPVKQVGEFHILELFHGPTLAFKDLALQLLGNLFEYILNERSRTLNILAATSGDTGSAAIYGVRGRERIHIFVMHPHTRVSPLQERQMTTVLDENVHNIALKGTFDDTQNIMKAIAGDIDFKRRHNLGAVNSVNWARVMAQIVYYFYAAFRVQEKTGAEKVRFSVPTGNFGDILAGYYAMKMGGPVERLLLATNENDILSRFFNTGTYNIGKVTATLAPSMDIQVASNFERYIFHKVGNQPRIVQDLMKTFARKGSIDVPRINDDDGPFDPDFYAGSANRENTLATIRKYYQQHNYIMDPHTAIGVYVAETSPLADSPTICLATAHPAKFLAAVREATSSGIVAQHPTLDSLKDKETRLTVLPAEADAVRDFMEKTLAGAK